MLMCEVQAVDKIAALTAGLSSLMSERDCEFAAWLDSIAHSFAYLQEDEHLEHILCSLFDCDIIAGVLKID